MPIAVNSNKMQKGFSLIEVLVALLLMTLVLMTLMSVAVLTMQMNYKNKLYETAIKITETQMNLVRSTKFDEIDSLEGTQTIQRVITKAPIDFVVTTTVNTPLGSGGTPDNNWRTVQVITRWRVLTPGGGPGGDRNFVEKSHTATLVLKRFK